MTSEQRTLPGDTALGSGDLLYLYGIVPAGSAAHRLLARRQIEGMQDGVPLFPIEADGLVAAVSAVPAALFDEEPLNALVSDLNRLTPYALRHEEAVRSLLSSPLVPMTFGAVYRGVDGIATLLREHRSTFGSLLERLRGCEEWGLKVFSSPVRLLESAAGASDQIRQMDAEIAALPPGRAYLATKRRERALAAEAGRLASVMLTAIFERLADLSAAAVQDEPGPPQPGAEQLVLKAAFLVDDDAVQEFRSVAEELGQTYSPRGLRLEVSGPWAPYSFVRASGGTFTGETADG